MTFEILTNPATSPASLLFQQCLVEIVPENRLTNIAKDEIGGYFLERTDPVNVTQDLWMKVINVTSGKEKIKRKVSHDPFLSQLPVALQFHLKDKKINWKSFKDVKIASILPKEKNDVRNSH